MQIAKFEGANGPDLGKVQDGYLHPLDFAAFGVGNLTDLLSHDEPAKLGEQMTVRGAAIPLDQVRFLPPIDTQEVWAAGVTYKRSKAARMEESEAAKDCYDRVYDADRPELFFKASPRRCRGHRGPLRIRRDATWNVPEPELALVISPAGKIVGYTIGNDMSSRDIEGDNPLYLPQAKVYNECCGLGPWITLAEHMPPLSEVSIHLSVLREGSEVFGGSAEVAQMKRKTEDLVQWLLRDNDMPEGAILLTGTGIVPTSDFTLQPKDIVRIRIDGIGELENHIVQG